MSLKTAGLSKMSKMSSPGIDVFDGPAVLSIFYIKKSTFLTILQFRAFFSKNVAKPRFIFSDCGFLNPIFSRETLPQQFRLVRLIHQTLVLSGGEVVPELLTFSTFLTILQLYCCFKQL